MQTIKHLILAAVLFTAPSTAFAGAYHDLAREPHGIEVPVPEPAPAPAAPAAKKITIYTAKTIVTEDPGTPTAEAVAVMDGKILGVGTLDEVKDWVTDEQVEIDQRFKDAVIVPGHIEAHMHPQITGILWQGVYVGRFDRTAPDGTLVKGLDTKEAVVERLKDAAAKLPADGRWLVGDTSRSSTAIHRSRAPISIQASAASSSSSMDRSKATPGCFSGRATTRLSPTESRTSPKTTSPSGSPRCTSAGSKP
jgi:hypothetical protein